MKILFISSGFSGIYPYFEKAIEKAIVKLNHEFQQIAPMLTKETAELVNTFMPDFVLSFAGYKNDKALMDLLRIKGIPLGIWLTDDPFYIDPSSILIKDYEYIFTIDLGAAGFYKTKFPNKKIYQLSLGTDPDLYYPDNPNKEYQYDLCLVGYPYPNRIELVRHILEETNFSILLAGSSWSKHIKHKNPNQLKMVHRWVEPGNVRQIFSQTKIILNPHRPHNYTMNQNSLGIENKSINNRTFDIAGCGGFQLISNMQDINVHFTPQEIVPYSDYAECIQLINNFINDENAIDIYSQNARNRVMSNHTFAHRVELLLKQITVEDPCP